MFVRNGKNCFFFKGSERPCIAGSYSATNHFASVCILHSDFLHMHLWSKLPILDVQWSEVLQQSSCSHNKGSSICLDVAFFTWWTARRLEVLSSQREPNYCHRKVFTKDLPNSSNLLIWGFRQKGNLHSSSRFVSIICELRTDKTIWDLASKVWNKLWIQMFERKAEIKGLYCWNVDMIKILTFDHT